MRLLLGLLAAALLCFGGSACGSGSSASSKTVVVPVLSKSDRDNDSDHNDDDNQVLYYGHAPTATERQEIVALITNYYAAAAAEDGAKACALLMPFMAEAVVENISHSPGLQGKTCATVMSKLFSVHHKELAGEHATLKFYSVRVTSERALNLLIFSTLPEVRQFTLRRDENGTWKSLNLLDGLME